MTDAVHTAAAPTRASLAMYFLRLGATGFGGPTALAGRMRADLVDGRRWLTHQEFELGLAVAAACPGPLAYQLATFCGFIRHGAFGAFAVGLTFVAAPFALVVAAASGYATWRDEPVVRGLFAGAAPAVAVLIVCATWSLGQRILHRARAAWLLCAASFALTWALGEEPIWLFGVAAITGILALAPARPVDRPGSTLAVVDFGAPATLALALPAAPGAPALFTFFFKAGCLVFGSGLALAPLMRGALVDSMQWITAAEFVDALTIGLVSPGPVVVTATFVGHLVGGFEGAVAATAGMFLPSILITVLVTPWFARHREHPALTGAVRGVTAAVVGALAGTVPLVLDTAVPGVAPAIILVATGLAARFARLPDPALVALGAAAGVLFIG